MKNEETAVINTVMEKGKQVVVLDLPKAATTVIINNGMIPMLLELKKNANFAKSANIEYCVWIHTPYGEPSGDLLTVVTFRVGVQRVYLTEEMVGLMLEFLKSADAMRFARKFKTN